MSRPALIVGLGGTGQWVLTWLKRDLQLSNNGKLPKNIRLLALDTSAKLEAGAERVTGSGQKEEAAVVGGITLEKNEFIEVGGNALGLAQKIRDGAHPHMRWYHAAQWIKTQMPATFDLEDGAGRLRQFGRLAVFKDMQGEQTGSLIWRHFNTAINEIKENSGNISQKVEIIVVGSFAGGTGSGMFIDIALVLRMLANQLKVDHVLRGYFALPSVFTTSPNTEMQARTFAAWRELNRFMVVDSDYPMPTIEYVAQNPAFRIRPDKRLFDACYLVDGKRNGKPISEEAKYGVFPMMAEVISALIDEKAGTAYTQWIFTNLAPEYARFPETPLYSAVGAYTVQVPAHFVQQKSSHKLGRQVLLKLLSPRKEPDEKGRFAAAGAERHLTLAARDKNLEDKGFSGRQRSLNFLSKTVERNGRQVKPTMFFGRIAQIYSASDEQHRASMIDQLARAGAADVKSAASTASWVTYYPDLGDDEHFESVRKTVQEFMSFSVVQQYGRREGEKEEEARPRLRKIPEDVRTRFGGVTSNGEEMEEYFGTCGDALMQCHRAQLMIARQMVRMHMVDLLMGRSEDPIEARSGKLGYAWDFFDGMVDVLSVFLKMMDDVRARREEIKPQLKIFGLADRAKKFVDSTTGKKIFWVMESPRVREAELAYLQAQQRMVEIRREEILHAFVVNTSLALKEMMVEAREEIQRWIWHLATGDDPSSIPGMWSDLVNSEEALYSAHSFDTRTNTVQKLVADEEISFSEAEVKASLQKWEWVAEYAGDPAQLHLKVKLLSDDAEIKEAELLDPTLGTTNALRMEIGKNNRYALMELVHRPFQGSIERTTISREIQDKYPEPEAFAAEIADVSAEPLFDGPNKAPLKKSNLIRVKIDAADRYFSGAEGLEGILRTRNGLAPGKRDDKYGIEVVGSENPYKMTLVRTDDLYRCDQFSAWEACMRDYASHMEDDGNPLDPVLMQNFSAEARAVEYERRLTQDGKLFTPLHPRVVMLLENEEALHQFIFLGMLGMIYPVESETAYHWELCWEKSTGKQQLWLTRGWNATVDEGSTRRPQPTIFNAIHGYVIIGVNQAPGRKDVIDIEFARRLIEKERSRLTLQGERKLILDNLADSGFVGWLRREAYDSDVPDRVIHQDYADLATIVEAILRDRLRKIDSVPVSGPRAPGIFATQKNTQGSVPSTPDIENKDVQQPGDDNDQPVAPWNTKN